MRIVHGVRAVKHPTPCTIIFIVANFLFISDLKFLLELCLV